MGSDAAGGDGSGSDEGGTISINPVLEHKLLIGTGLHLDVESKKLRTWVVSRIAVNEAKAKEVTVKVGSVAFAVEAVLEVVNSRIETISR